MTKNEYNGWFNYETWLVNLWMGNDQGSDIYYRELAQECWDRFIEDAVPPPYWSHDEAAQHCLAERLKDEFEEAMSDLLRESNRECSVWSDLLGAALSEVNWDEIASHYIEDVEKSEVAQ